MQAMEGFGDSVLVSKNPLGPNDFSQAAHEGIVIRKGVHTVTGDISSEMTLKKPDVQVVDAYGNALKRSREVYTHTHTQVEQRGMYVYIHIYIYIYIYIYICILYTIYIL
jgi:hypothetical protein